MLGEVEKMAGYLERSDIYQPDTKAQEDRGPITVTEKATSARHHARALITGKAVAKTFLITLQGTSDCLRTS
jgi:hypothetical protein